MPDVVVNITGNASQLENTLNNVGQGNRQQPLPPRTGITPTPGGITPSGNSISPSNPPSGGGIDPNNSPAIPTYDRMAQDIRREILSRGVMMVPGSSNFQQLMTAVTNQQRTTAYKNIDDKWTIDVTQTQKDFEEKRKVELQRLEQERADAIANAVTPNQRLREEKRYNDRISGLDDKINVEKALAFQQLNNQRDSAKQRVDEDLAKIAEELVQELRKGNPNSYLGQLREQYRNAIWRRDNAESESEVKEGALEAARIQKRIAAAQSPMTGLDYFRGISGITSSAAGLAIEGYQKYRQNTFNKIAIINAAADGNAFDAMEQDYQRRKSNAGIWGMIGGAALALGGIIASPFTMGGSLAATATGVGLIAGGAYLGNRVAEGGYDFLFGEEEKYAKLGKMWSQQAKRNQSFNNLASLTKYQSGNSYEDERENILKTFSQDRLSYIYNPEVNGMDLYDLGFDASSFSDAVASRIKQRGFFDEGGLNSASERTLRAIGYERLFNLNEGDLGKLSAYDRYRRKGKRINDANIDFVNLATGLSSLNTTGMNDNEWIRGSEFLGYHSQLMEMQKGWMTAPDSSYANRWLLAAQNKFGDNLDSRHISQIGQLENAITHPKEDYTKALLYDVIQDVLPGTKGNLLAIRQAQYNENPETRIAIQRAMIKKIEQVYGGVDTTSGYLAFSHYTGIEKPQDLANWVSQIKSGLPQENRGNADNMLQNISNGNYTDSVTKELNKTRDSTILAINDSCQQLVGIGNRMLTDFKDKLQEIIDDLK